MAARPRPRARGDAWMGDAVKSSDASLMPESLLELARESEACHRHDDAFLAYYRAIIVSQRAGRWHDAATTPPQLLDRVRHAMRYAKAGRRQFFLRALEAAYEGHGRGALARFERCLA